MLPLPQQVFTLVVKQTLDLSHDNGNDGDDNNDGVDVDDDDSKR